MILPPVRTGDSGHAEMHNSERARLNALCILPTPLASAEANVAAIRAAITAAKDGTVTLGPGVWAIDDTIELRGKFGAVLQGVGYQTRLVWRGSADRPIIRVANSQQCAIRDLWIQAAQAAREAIYLVRDSGAGITPSKNVCEHVVIEGGGYLAYGWHVDYESHDANNDFHVCRDVTATGYTDAAFYMNGTQSYNNEFYNCHALGYGKYGVATSVATSTALFSWYGGSMAHHSEADFRIGFNVFGPVRIEGVNSERSRRFIDAYEPQGQWPRTIIVNGVRWANADFTEGAEIMRFYGQCRVDIANSTFAEGASPSLPHVIRYDGWGVHAFRFVNNTVYSTAEQVFSSVAPTVMDGNMRVTDVSQAQFEDLTP